MLSSIIYDNISPLSFNQCEVYAIKIGCATYEILLHCYTRFSINALEETFTSWRIPSESWKCILNTGFVLPTHADSVNDPELSPPHPTVGRVSRDFFLENECSKINRCVNAYECEYPKCKKNPNHLSIRKTNSKQTNENQTKRFSLCLIALFRHGLNEHRYIYFLY